MRDELSAAERRSVVRHLLTGCPRCVKVTRRCWSLGSPRFSAADDSNDSDTAGNTAEGELSGGVPALRPDAFDGIAAALRRRQRRLTGEHERAPRLLAEMMAHPRARRLALVCGEERFRNLALGELLLEKSRLEAQRDPASATETAELAAAVADRLDPGLWGATLTGLLRARAWAFLGEARRLAGELRSAERALAVAEVLLEHTGPDPLDRAELLCLEASLAQDLRRLDEADRLLDRALDLYRRAGDRQLQGQTLLRKGMLRGAMRRKEAPLQAADLLRAGLALVDEAAQPRLAAEALHRLGGFLLEAGRGDEALRAVERARALYEAMGEPDAAAALLAFRRLAETGSAVPELLAEIGRSLATRPAGSLGSKLSG
jgi:tetratricopeptide (TPR) repeat protein